MLKNKLQSAIVNSWSESHRSGHFHLEVALSGGLDSVALLHLLVSLQEQMNWHVSAVHVNHQLQEVSEQWVVFCQKLCQQWNVSLRIETVDVVQVSKLGVEAAARKVRYEAFSKTAADVVVLAHHSDDQVETALLAFLRGGGIRALAAMPAWRDLTQATPLWRPLLNISKVQLEQYVDEAQLLYVDDPSNTDSVYVRNWLRQTVLPKIVAYEEHAKKKILAGIYQRQQELALIEEIQKKDWLYICENKIFSINRLLNLSRVRQEQQLLYFANQNQLGAWSRAKLNHFLEELLNSPYSRHQIELGLGEICADRGRLYPWGDKYQIKITQLFIFFEKVFITEANVADLELALIRQIGNAERSWIAKKNGIYLMPLSQLRLLVSAVELQKLIKTLKAKKVPLFVIEHWPCWFHEETHQVLAAKIQDNEIRQQFPVWEEKLAFLEVYLIKAD